MNVKTLPVRAGTRLFIPGDIHFPVHWEALLRLYHKSLPAIMKGRAGQVVLIGDTFDSFGLSTHQKAAKARRTRGRIKDEVAAGAPHVKAFTRWPTTVLTGNHEDWWDDVVDENPALEGFEWWDMYRGALEGAKVMPYGTALMAGPLFICHGDELLGSLSKQSARTVLSNYPGQNSLYGHTHRIDQCTRPTAKNGGQVTHGAWSIGHSRDPDRIQEDKVLRPFADAWEAGGAVVDFYADAGELYFTVQLIRVFRDAKGRPMFQVDGEVYR
jgi:hypothetical protein